MQPDADIIYRRLLNKAKFRHLSLLIQFCKSLSNTVKFGNFGVGANDCDK